MTLTYLTAATIWPADRARFHLSWVYLNDDRPTEFAGYWLAPGGSAPDGKVGLYLDLVRREGGAVAVALVADRTDVHGTQTLAAWAALSPATWPQAVAPTVAEHPWVGRTVTEWEEKPCSTAGSAPCSPGPSSADNPRHLLAQTSGACLWLPPRPAPSPPSPPRSSAPCSTCACPPQVR